MSSKTTRALIGAILMIAVGGSSASAADCGVVINDLSKAISGHLTMSPDKKASMLRMAVSSYDHCMVGDSKASGDIQAMLMKQLRENLGGN